MNNFNCYNVEPKKQKLFFNKAIIRLLLDEYIIMYATSSCVLWGYMESM